MTNTQSRPLEGQSRSGEALGGQSEGGLPEVGAHVCGAASGRKWGMAVFIEAPSKSRLCEERDNGWATTLSPGDPLTKQAEHASELSC